MKTLKSGVQISDHMVTTDEWNKVMGDKRPPGMTLMQVSAEEADMYAAKIGGRLPTEKEWEEVCGKESALGAFWEWTSTVDGAARVLRGGSWNDSAGICRAAFRGRGWAIIRNWVIGFRVCFDNLPATIEGQ